MLVRCVRGVLVRVEQAVFTSIRSGRNEGYQLAACSAGITTEQQRELAQWGPGHDSLYSDLPNAESVNFHQMADGMYCVSRSVLAGREYSGRGGQRVFTHIFLLPAEGLERFGNSPFRIIDSLVVGGRCGVEQVECGDLEPFELVGRASLVNVANLEQVVRILGPERLASLVQAALVGERIAVAAPVSGRRLFYALLDLLPPHYRPDYSLTTGLKLAATRNYRLSTCQPKLLSIGEPSDSCRWRCST